MEKMNRCRQRTLFVDTLESFDLTRLHENREE